MTGNRWPGKDDLAMSALVTLRAQAVCMAGRRRGRYVRWLDFVGPGDCSMAIYVDADACPVKEEVYRVARRYAIPVLVVSNSPIRVPQEDLIVFVGVRGGFDVADDWIAERAGRGDIVITADIVLAGRCLQQGVRVLGPKGDEFTEDDIGDALATRALLEMLRQSGDFRGGPAPFAKSDRSRFLSRLDQIIQAIRREPRS